MTVAEHYEQTVNWLEGLYRRPHQPAAQVGLQRVGFLLERLGNPQHDFRSVHVAGTVGKGSTTTMIGSVLQTAGNRTGYFRSPHLQSYRERIAVDDRMVDEAAWIRCFNEVVAVAEQMELSRDSTYNLGRPTVFEVLFAMAALHFRTEGVEWAAVETGMGGRLDATNTLRSEVAVVTNVSLEHTQVLGRTVEEIAREKAAIINRGADAVTGTRDDRVRAVLARRADEQGVRLRCIDRDFSVCVAHSNTDPGAVSLSDSTGTIRLVPGLGGGFQALNAATAFGAARCLQQRGVSLTDGEIARGIEGARLPGRFEVAARSPTVLLDGGHNPAAMDALRQSLGAAFTGRRIVILFAAMVDKDVQAMADAIGPVADVVITTRVPGSERSAAADAVAAAFEGRSRRVAAIDEPIDALGRAAAEASRDDVLLVTGSIYLVGWARAQLAPAGGRE